jgi:Met-zincin
MTARSPRWLALALLAVGCAQSNGDVNRVQPNVTKKTDLLDGQWYFRNTVTYTPFNTQFTYPGQTGVMEKLVWEIQETALVGYRSYPYTLGVDPTIDPGSKVSGTTAKRCDAKGVCVGGQKYYGAPVVAFPIVSHFDIQRGYNPATGEQTNVIAENSTDRPWNEREYIRVSWSANLLNKMAGVNFGTVQNAVGGSSNNNWIQPNEPGSDPTDWPTSEYEDRNNDGVPELVYFDVTGRYVANPDMYFIDGWGSVPACWFRSGVYDCSSSEIHVRTSLAKVDPIATQDYEPLQYDNSLMTLFGFFRTERLNWDKKFGYNDSAVVRLANRHRVWKEYYQKDANGQVTDQPIALADRVQKPIVYYFTPAARMGGEARYAEFWEPGRKLEQDYDRAFRRAIGAAKGKAPEQVDQMFYLCNNPVKDGDPGSCGAPGFAPRVGDLRRSFVNTVAEPVANGLLGYGPSSTDPETGETISGMSNTYTWGVDEYGRRVTNWILLLSGEQDIADYLKGSDVKNFIAQNPAYNLDKLNRQIASIQSELQGIPQRSEETKGAFSRPTERLTALVNLVASDPATLVARGDELKRAADQLANNPALEAAVLDNPDMQADLLNLLPPFARAAAEKDPTFLRQASRSVLTNIQLSQSYEKARVDWLSNNNITTFDFADRALVSLALQKMNSRLARIAALRATGLSVADATTQATDEVAKQIRQSVWLATALHETGHTLGLRHNFQGSFDAVNYFDDYWDVKKATLTVDQNNQKKLPRTPNDIKAAADGTETQQLLGLHDHEYSSIMDYAGKIFGDFNGIGKYDEAALLFAYSGDTAPGYVEVFDQARRASQAFPGSDGAMMTISGAGADLPMVNATHLNPNVRNYTERFHYTTVPLHFGVGGDLTTVINDGILKLRKRSLAKYSDVLADEDRVRAALAADPGLIDDPDRAMGVLGAPRLRVPYMFCSDESADGPVLSCNRFDRGPDYYEMVRTKLEDYWNYYVDTHFRRDAAFFSGSGALNRTYGTFSFVSNSYKHWVYEFLKQATPSQQQQTQYKIDPMLQDTWTLAVLDGVNQHLNVMSVPPDGMFMFRNLRNTSPRWDLVTQGQDFDYLNPVGRQAIEDLYSSRYGALDFVVLPRGLGRRMYSRYDYKSGYNFFTRMLEAGHYNDQVGAMFAAVSARTEFQGVDQTADSTRYNIPYYLVFRNEFQNTFSALWSQDEDKIRPILYKTIDNANQVQDNANLFWRVYVRGDDLFSGFNYPKALPGQCAPGQNPGGTNPPACFLPAQNAAPANIQLTWTSRIYSLYLGMALFRVNYDLDYAKANQIFKVGGGEAFTVAAGYHTVEVQDPVNGQRYVAIEKDGAAANATGAVKMISIARDYLSMVNAPATCPLPDYLFYQGYACLAADQANNPSIIQDRKKYWTELFQDSIRDLDLQRGMYSLYGMAF